MKLLYGGVFERSPNLSLILAHLGGTLPYLARRIDLGWRITSSQTATARSPAGRGEVYGQAVL